MIEIDFSDHQPQSADIAICYRRLRRRIRKCGCVDCLRVIWAYSQFTQVHDFEFPADIDKHQDFQNSSRTRFLIQEWELELIASEAVLHARYGIQSLRDWSTLARIVQRLRDLENELYGLGQKDIFIEFARISHRQFPWQQSRPTRHLLYRYHRIFSDPKINESCHRVLGLSVDALYVCGIATYAHFLTTPALRVPVMLDLPGISTREIAAFLGFAGRSLSELRAEISAEHKVDDSYAYQVGPLRKYPLIRVESERTTLIMCPLPSLLFWRVTSGLYYDLMRGDPDFGNAIGASFQRYVGDVLESAVTRKDLRVIPEEKYGAKRHRKDTCDWLLTQENQTAVFIECKVKRITLPAKRAMGDLSALQRDFDKLADAITQLYQTMKDYSEDRYPNLPYLAERKCFPVVVTLEDWYLFGDRLLGLLQEAVMVRMRDAGLSEELLVKAPYSVMSIDEFEDAVPIIDKVGVATFFEGKLNDTELRRWAYGSYMQEKFRAEHISSPPIFCIEAEKIFDDLIEIASQPRGL